MTVRDVAEAADVALSSASRVFSNHPNVSKRMRERVLSAANELGYEPDLVARTLRTGISHTLGFLVADMANPISSMFVSGVEDTARTRGFGLLLTNSEGDPRHDAANLQLFLRRRVDAIILLTADQGGEIERTLDQHDTPVVVLDRDIPMASGASAVYFDHAMGVRDATRHLAQVGHERIAFISGPQDLRPVRSRLDGFRRGLEEAGLASDGNLIRLESLRPAYAREQTLDLLAGRTKPTAIIVGANQLLTGVLDALHESQIAVGRDLAIVSTDDVDLTRFYRPSISCVARDVYKAGQVAAELALEQLNQSDAPARSVVLPTWLVTRESTPPPGTAPGA